MLPGMFIPSPSGLPSGFVGAQTFTSDQGDLDFTFNVPEAQVGDLVYISFCFDAGFDDSWSWDTPSLSWADPPQLDLTGGFFSSEIVGYENYAVWDGTTTTIKTTGVGGTSWRGLSGVICVFRGITTSGGGSFSLGSSGMPNGPAANPGYALYVVSGWLDDDAITMTAPSGWTLAAANNHTFSGNTTSIAVAFNYDGLNNPDAFGGGGNDQWIASTAAFS